MGFVCDGYAKPKPMPVEPRGLVPRTFKDLVPKVTSQSLSPERTLSTYHFENQQEYLSFQIFYERSMFQFVGSETSDLWDRIVLQACEHQGAIRNAVVAIGALSCTLDSSRPEKDQVCFDLTGKKLKDADRHQFALQKYGCAIGQMRRDLERGQYDLRTTLICCILVVCFELFEGNHASALIHATSGLDLINERRNKPQESHITGQMENFEEGLGDIFMRLDRTVKPFALESLFDVQYTTRDSWESAPKEPFRSCKEARRAWNWTAKSISQSMGLVQRRTSELGEEFRTRTTSHTPSTDSEDDLEEEALQVDLVFSRARSRHRYPEYELELLLQWYTCFQPLFNESRSSNDTQSRAEAAFLQGKHHINLIALTCAQFDDELQYDNFTPIFQEIIELSEEILIEQKRPDSHRPVFTFDTGVVGFLWVVATKCRDSAIRWKAVSLLRESPKREGRWHSAFVAKGAAAVIHLEEQSVENMIIPEWARIKTEGVTFELVSRKGILTYSRLPRFGEFALRKRIREKMEVLW
ncbi:hypothetical protein ONS95_002059 [Cadophora gregata]|uniref:uncharacterized protein n=1 Tax=Cadophora gregata TaxID=51156 RepID=UPI0026DD202E|nr:uncharacterized protein ONS95_002059 [Cadophora gregata]KAK0111716.1 hypothetical protein ONS95_002059 [Cadophora gregata]